MSIALHCRQLIRTWKCWCCCNRSFLECNVLSWNWTACPTSPFHSKTISMISSFMNFTGQFRCLLSGRLDNDRLITLDRFIDLTHWFSTFVDLDRSWKYGITCHWFWLNMCNMSELRIDEKLRGIDPADMFKIASSAGLVKTVIDILKSPAQIVKCLGQV